MTKLEEIRNKTSDVIKVSKLLYIKIEGDRLQLYQKSDCTSDDTTYSIMDNEIKPLIKKLQELTK